MSRILGQGDELLDQLSGLDGAVLVAADRLLHQLGKGPRLDDILA